MEIVIAKEQAVIEVNGWLDFKRVRPSVREVVAANIDAITEAVMYGDVTIDRTTFVITHNLAFPITNAEGKTVISAFQYQPRLNIKQVDEISKEKDQIMLALKLCAALSGQAVGIVNLIQPTDLHVISNIAPLFL